MGEVEILVDSEEGVAAAADKIAGFAAESGLSAAPDDKAPGKMEMYLWLYNREAYIILEKAGVLTGKCE